MINKDNLFNLFPDPDKVPDDSLEADIEIHVTESAHYRVGMFTKLILNQKNFLRQIKGFFDRAGKEIDMDDHKVQSEFVVYNRAWHYIKGIDLDSSEHLADIVISNIYDLAYTLHLAIKYFEKGEEYEKCAHLYSIQKFIEEFEATKIDDATMTLLEDIKDNLEK